MSAALAREAQATIRGALDLLQQKIEGHDYGPAFTYKQAQQLRFEALGKVEAARDAIRHLKEIKS